jgi:hypothetical protein
MNYFTELFGNKGDAVKSIQERQKAGFAVFGIWQVGDSVIITFFNAQ